MSFLSPLALLLAGLSVPLLLLYFLKVRRREMAVSSLLLWDPALRDREASTFFQRLQRDPLLILQILALLLLAAALARPAITVMGHGNKRVVIVHGQLGVDEGDRRVAVALRAGAARGARPPRRPGRGRGGHGDRGRRAAARRHAVHAQARRGRRGDPGPPGPRPAESAGRGRAHRARARRRGSPGRDPRVHRRRASQGARGAGERPARPLGRRRTAVEQRRRHGLVHPAELLRHAQHAGLHVGGELLAGATDVLADADARRRDAGRADAHARAVRAPRGRGAVHRSRRRGRAPPLERLRRPGRRQRRLRRAAPAAADRGPPRQPGEPLPREGAQDGPAGEARGEEARGVPGRHGERRRRHPRLGQSVEGGERAVRAREHRAAGRAARGARAPGEPGHHGLGPDAPDHAPARLREDRDRGRAARPAARGGQDARGERRRTAGLHDRGARPKSRLLRLRSVQERLPAARRLPAHAVEEPAVAAPGRPRPVEPVAPHGPADPACRSSTG